MIKAVDFSTFDLPSVLLEESAAAELHAHGSVAAAVLVLLAAAIAYWILQEAIIADQGEASVLKQAVGSDWKGKSSPLLYVCGIALTGYRPWLGQAIYVAVALMWLVPDRRIEKAMRRDA